MRANLDVLARSPALGAGERQILADVAPVSSAASSACSTGSNGWRG